MGVTAGEGLARRQRNALGVIEITSVATVDAISDDDAVAAGFADASEALAAIDKKSRGGSLFRIGVRYVGADPRLTLREHADLDPDELDSLRQRLRRHRPRRRLDRVVPPADRGEPWRGRP